MSPGSIPAPRGEGRHDAAGSRRGGHLDEQLAFHLDAGVDFVIATDNRSQDGTTEILERYARDGRLHLIRETGDDLRQSEWVTRMARLAATEFGADWVLERRRRRVLVAAGGEASGRPGGRARRATVSSAAAWRNFVPSPGRRTIRSPSG